LLVRVEGFGKGTEGKGIDLRGMGEDLDRYEAWTDVLTRKAGNRMRNLTNARAIWTKGVLFLLLGISSAVLVFLEAPSPRVAVLLAVAIWGFCRAYYFAFYVIEKYVDPGYRFSGLGSFVRYCLEKRAKRLRGRQRE